MRTRVKICGITRVEDALQAAQSGADALGLVFYAKSPRAVEIEQARTIVQAVPAFVTTVALFVDPSRSYVEEVIERTSIDLLQFHGDEPETFCSSFSRPYIKALRMQPGVCISQLANTYQSAQGILLDAWVDGVPGGTGQTFNWEAIPALNQPLILAGGLNSANAQQAIQSVRPWALDVSGGVEASKGIKSKEKIQDFMQAVLTA